MDRQLASSCGVFDLPHRDRSLEDVVDVLHLFPRQRVNIRGAASALDERDDLVAIDAAAEIQQACRACHAEHPADLALRGSPGVAAGAQPQERRRGEFHRLGCNALVEEHAEERRGRERVAQCVVRIPISDAAAVADRLQAMISGERLEQPEPVERARHPDGVVVDARERERVFEHRQVERGVVRDEHGAIDQLVQLACDLIERWRRRNVLVADPVHRRRLGRDRSRGTNEPRVPGALDAARVEPHRGERDNLVLVGRRPRRLAVEYGVGDRRRHLPPPSDAPMGATDTGRNRHAPTMSGGADGDLTAGRTSRGSGAARCGGLGQGGSGTMGEMALAARHALIAGLRQRRSETELTQTLASVFAAEPVLGASFLRLVLKHAPRAAGIDRSALPKALECRAEQRLDEGRADLIFTDAAGQWHAIVEIKIYARYRAGQVDDYVLSLRPVKHGVVVAITRDVPTSGESADDLRWAGSVQWSKLLPGLRDLRPADLDLAAQWPRFLDVLVAEGDMGFTKPNTELFQAWVNYHAARKHVTEFLDTMCRALLDELRAALVGPDAPAKTAAAAADFATHGKRVVVTQTTVSGIGFEIPARGPELLWVGVWSDSGELHFSIDIGYPVATETNAEQRSKAVETLTGRGFEVWRDDSLVRDLVLAPELLAEDDLQLKVLDFAKESFAMLKESGIFELGAPATVPMRDDATDDVD